PPAGGRYELDILAEHASSMARIGRLPSTLSSSKFFCWNVELNKALLSVDRDRITFPHQCNQSPLVSFRRDMTDNHSPGSAGKPSIGEKAYRCAEPLSDQGRRWRKHFLHAGPALWALVADHDHIARLDLLIQDCPQAFGFRIEHACSAGD